MHAVWILTRPGFEVEAGQEYLDQASQLGVFGYFKPYPSLGLVSFVATGDGSEREILVDRLPMSQLVFARDAYFMLTEIQDLSAQDRVGDLLEAMAALEPQVPWGSLEVHVPEGSQDGDLSKFARKWTAPAAKALREKGWLSARRNPEAARLELLLLDFQHLLIAESLPGHRAVYAGGRPHLRLPSRAPSRSTLKLEEAFQVLLNPEERETLLLPGMKAVDLGAAPGGWTYQLVQRDMFVTAIDNGPMDEALMESGQVEHLRADGYAWMPDKPVDWMVCDIVDKPRRTIEMVSRWLVERRCRCTVFNLKLPMKQRLAEWYLCLERLSELLAQCDGKYEVRAKQLYHDREEITVMVLPA
ncbi:23S rRNA (cytidine(2498)-2'-O)-methyltransferase RlmM [Marinobacteraceae bacterium S3BR75-40.1]